jgi:hypothetical protein
MPAGSASARVREAEQFVKEHLSRTEVSTVRPYERAGVHVTVGQEKPLAADFTSSGSQSTDVKKP